MKRILGALLLTISLAAMPLGTAHGAPDPGDTVQGPACGDIDGGANYADRHFPATTRQFAATVFGTVDSPDGGTTCSQLSYKLTVYAHGTTTVLGTDSKPGDGTAHLDLQVIVPGEPGTVCVEVTSYVGGHTVDRAPNGPDGGCAVGAALQLNGGFGASGWR